MLQMQLFVVTVVTVCFLRIQTVLSQTCSDESIDIPRLLNYFDEKSRANFVTSTSVLTFRPSQSLQGFGNLMVGTYGMILLANANAAVPLVAHSMSFLSETIGGS